MSQQPFSAFKNDKLGLKPFSEKLENFLMIDHGFADGSLVVSLNAPFGSGKTTFLSMWKTDLEQRRIGNPDLPIPILLNAWESDYCGDPLLSIVTGLIKAAADGVPEKSESGIERFKEAAKDFFWFAAGLGNNAVSKLTPFDPAKAGELAEKKKKERQPEKPDFVALYEHRTAALSKLKATLAEVFGGDDLPKALVFVDELDRCRPDYAITYLETIKHVFDVHGLVFLLAVDYDHLGNSARALFGRDLNFSEYFRKFVHRTISLPKPDKSGLSALAEHYTYHFLHKEDKRWSKIQIRDRLENIVELVGALAMTPRQIQESFRILGHLAGAGVKQDDRLYWCLQVGSILMCTLKAAMPDVYRSIGDRSVSHLEIGRVFSRRLKSDVSFWWFCVYITGVGRRDEDPVIDFDSIFRDLGFLTPEQSVKDNINLSQFFAGWGHSTSGRFEQIYDRIEGAAAF